MIKSKTNIELFFQTEADFSKVDLQEKRGNFLINWFYVPSSVLQFDEHGEVSDGFVYIHSDKEQLKFKGKTFREILLNYGYKEE